ncbi:hypothetical protein HDF11_005425 [Tunturiibacter psychrotolerans]
MPLVEGAVRFTTIPPITTDYSQMKAEAEVEFQLGIPRKCIQRSHVAVRSKVPGVLSAIRKLPAIFSIDAKITEARFQG